MTTQHSSDHRGARPGREHSDAAPTRTKSRTDTSQSKADANLKITEPVLKNIHEHSPHSDVTPQVVTLYGQFPGVSAISQYSNMAGADNNNNNNNNAMITAIRNYENPITSYLKNNPVDSRLGINNGDNSHIRRQIIHQQTLITPYPQYYQQPSLQGNRPGYLFVNQPNGGYQQNSPNFENNPNTVGSSSQTNNHQNGNDLSGFQNSVTNENKEKPVLGQNVQLTSNTLPLVRPNYQHSQNNNGNINSRNGYYNGPYSTIYGSESAQPQQYTVYPNTNNVSPYTGVTYRQNYQNQNYGNLNSNLDNAFPIMQPPSVEYTSNSGVNSYLSSPSYANYRNWRPNQQINAIGYEQPQNINGYAQNSNQNTQPLIDGRQLSIPWPFAQYFPIVIKDPLVSMLSGFTSMVEYGPEADLCKPLDNKKEGNLEEVADPVDSSNVPNKEQQTDMRTRAKRLLDVEAQKAKAIESRNEANVKVGRGVSLDNHHERLNEKLKISPIQEEEYDLSFIKPPPVASQHQNHGRSSNVEISRSIELDVAQVFGEGRLHQLGIQLPQHKPVHFAPQVSESKNVEARVNSNETPPKTDPETRNAKDEFEIINVNLPKQDGGLFEGRQDVPKTVDDDVELVNVNRKPGNISPPVAPALVPEGRISDDVELIDVSDQKEKTKMVVSSKQLEDFVVEQERRKDSGPTIINKDQSLSTTLEIMQDDAKQEGEEDSDKEPEDEEEEDEESEEDDENKPDVEIQTEPTVNVTEVNEDPKQEEHDVILTTGSHGNYGPVIRRLVVRKGGVAIAGPGGIATAGPGGVAVVGPGGTAYTRPNGVAIVGPGGKVVGLPNDMVFQHGGVAVIHHADGSEPRMERVTTDKDGLPPGARVLAYGPTVYFHPPDLLI